MMADSQPVPSTCPTGRQYENKQTKKKKQQLVAFSMALFVGGQFAATCHPNCPVNLRRFGENCTMSHEGMREVRDRILLRQQLPSSPPQLEQLEIGLLVHPSQVQSPRAPSFSCSGAALHHPLILVISDLNLFWHWFRRRFTPSPVNIVHPVPGLVLSRWLHKDSSITAFLFCEFPLNFSPQLWAGCAYRSQIKAASSSSYLLSQLPLGWIDFFFFLSFSLSTKEYISEAWRFFWWATVLLCLYLDYFCCVLHPQDPKRSCRTKRRRRAPVRALLTSISCLTSKRRQQNCAWSVFCKTRNQNKNRDKVYLLPQKQL